MQANSANPANCKLLWYQYAVYIMPSIENYVYQHVQYYIHVHGCTTIECSTYVRSRTISVAAIENTPSLNAVQQINNKSTLRVHFRGPGGAFAPPPSPTSLLGE